MKRKNKPVPFTDNETKLLEWAESQDKPFATYVKDLIRDDMKKHERYKKDELKVLVREILQEINVKTDDLSVTSEKSKLGNKSKKAYKNLMNSMK